MTPITDEELSKKSGAELIAYNEVLMATKGAISEEQLKVKAILNRKAALIKFNALPDAEKQAIVQHVNAGSLEIGG